MKAFVRILPVCIIAAIITTIFFYKTFLFGQIPFPGDLLLAEYKPWQAYSFAGFVPGSIPNKAQYPDTIRQLYPWRTLVTNELKAGKIPLWNPYNFSGTPILANFQSAVFYPLNVLYLLVPQATSWTLLVILQSYLALLFTYGYIRTLSGSKLTSWFGAITYTFSLFSTVWIEYNTIGQVMIWLPLSLFAIEHITKKENRNWIIVLVFSQVSALLAGHPQLAAYMIFFTFFYAWFRTRQIIKFVFLSTVLAIGISAVQIIPGIELSLYAARSAHDFLFIFQKILIQPQQILMAIVPNLFGHPATRTYWPADTFVGKATYIGIIPLFFLLAAFRLKTQIIKFFSIAALFILILMTANPITFFLYKLNIPLFSSSSPTLMGFLFAYCLAILASLGLDAWIKEKHSVQKLAHRSLTVLIFFILIWISFKFSPHAATAQKAILYSFGLAMMTLMGFVLAITHRKLMIAVLSALLLIHAADLFVQFQKFNPFVPVSFVFPPAPLFTYLEKNTDINRFWGYGSASIEANFATQYRLFSPDGYDPLYPKRYGEFIGLSHDGKFSPSFTTQTRSDATIAPGYGEKDFATNPYRLRMLNILGVKYILDRVENNSTSQTFPPNKFTQIYNQDGWKILENLQTEPRILFASEYKVFKNNSEFEKLFFNDAFDPKKTILLEETLPGEIKQPIVADTVSVNRYESNEILVSTKADGARLLFFSDTYYPGWKAFIDNKETKIYRADYAFRALYIPEGTHEVLFLYEPNSFRLGIIISSASIILALIAFFTVSLKHEDE